MAKLNSYLNFDGNAEEAFRFYQSIFGGELTIHKMADMPGAEHLAENEKHRVMHISLPIGEDVLMASDILPSMGHVLNVGNNNYISVFTSSREEAERLYAGLSEGGVIEMPLEDMFWGDYYSSFADKFHVKWMVNYPAQNP